MQMVVDQLESRKALRNEILPHKLII